jgi:hypothetical protein
MDAACAAAPAGEQCSEQGALYQRAASLYAEQQEAHRHALQECEGRGSLTSPHRPATGSLLP